MLQEFNGQVLRSSNIYIDLLIRFSEIEIIDV